jgi:acyl carrier protein
MNTPSAFNALPAIQNIIRDIFLDDNLKVTENTSPADILEWDSLAHVNIIAAVETKFNVRFTVEEIASIDSVSHLLTALSRHGRL